MDSRSPGHREQVQRLLYRVPVFFPDQDPISPRTTNQNRLMIARRVVEKPVKLLARLTGVHAVHKFSLSPSYRLLFAAP